MTRVQISRGTLLVALLLAGCGPNRATPADFGGGGEGGATPPLGGVSTGGGGGTNPVAGGGGGQAGHGTEGGGGAGGLTPQGGAAGTAGAVATSCGNDAIDPGEPCDGVLLDDKTCASFGFDAGELTCVDCRFVTTACSGTEGCFDGRDNDGDGASDCADTACSDECASLCGYAPLLADDPGVVVTGDTTGHTSATSASCGAGPGLTGREVVYRFTPSQDGILEARLESATAELTLSVREGNCESGAELDCGLGRTVLAPVTAGEDVFLVVDGETATDVGPFELVVGTRPIVCGDGVIDPGEPCDHGGTPTAGCAADCVLQSSESEPPSNDTAQHADAVALGVPYFGAIDPAADVDVLELDVSGGPTNVRISVFDLGNGACEAGDLDSALEVLDATEVVVAADDDSGVGLCSELVLTGLADGTYYIRVLAAPTGDTPAFPYGVEAVAE